jgi:hypothetical protein
VRYTPAGGRPQQELLVSSVEGKEADRQKILIESQKFADTLPVERRMQYIDNCLLRRSVDEKRAIPYLSAASGDKFHSHNTPEDGCNYEVANENGMLGLKANCYFKGGHTAIFITAVDALPASETQPFIQLSHSFRQFWIGPVGRPTPVKKELSAKSDRSGEL